VTFATVWLVITCPAFAGAASSSAASEVVAKSAGMEERAGMKADARPGREAREIFGMDSLYPLGPRKLARRPKFDSEIRLIRAINRF
jgi:hypothetical protein